ncbi:helix-turn-helix domain-containing protein [Rhodoferax sp.]|uniref:helix-turn-helix domain-containing protein n=1 Tax=Rhodoferax sp. TaxID=50421 RepID=UPI0025FFDF39|nr:helix-turn-helix domain-containing protein [Rhodoferax sp.]
MQPATALPHFHVFHCSDSDEQAAVLRAWNQSYCQLSAGAFAGSVTEIDTGAVHIVVERLNRAVLQRGALPPHCVAVGVPLQLEGHSLLCGQRSHLNGLHVFSGVDGFEFRSPEQHVVVDIEFYPARFANPALREALARIAQALGPRATVLDLPGERMDALRQMLRAMLDAVGHAPDVLDNPAVCEAFEKSLVYGLLDLLEAEPLRAAAPPPSTNRNWRLVQTARSHIEQASRDGPLSVAELVAVLGVSRRCLQYAFQDALGVNPASYLRTERLNRVRRVLRVWGDADSVTEAATRFGFWHFGHFASDYRALFGELPSDTFRLGRGLAAPARPPQPPSTGWRG